MRDGQEKACADVSLEVCRNDITCELKFDLSFLLCMCVYLKCEGTVLTIAPVLLHHIFALATWI